MALEQRIRALERDPKLQPKGPEKDPLLEYEITKERFDTLCKNHKAFHRPPRDKEDLLRSFSEEQVTHIIRNYYGNRVNGKLVDPTPVQVEGMKGLSSLSLSDWYRYVVEDLLVYPHRLAFDLADFGLEDMLPKVLETEHTEYKPQISSLSDFENED